MGNAAFQPSTSPSNLIVRRRPLLILLLLLFGLRTTSGDDSYEGGILSTPTRKFLFCYFPFPTKRRYLCSLLSHRIHVNPDVSARQTQIKSTSMSYLKKRKNSSYWLQRKWNTPFVWVQVHKKLYHRAGSKIHLCYCLGKTHKSKFGSTYILHCRKFGNGSVP